MPSEHIERQESTVTSLTWIPSEAVEGGTRLAFDAGFTHYDDPPPGEIGDIEALRAADRFRFANVLRAWAEVDDSGRVLVPPPVPRLVQRRVLYASLAQSDPSDGKPRPHWRPRQDCFFPLVPQRTM